MNDQDDADLIEARKLLTAALTIIERRLEAPSSPRDPNHFLPNGRHLSPAGEAAIYALFDQGMSIERAARTMGISFKGAELRRKKWLAIKSGK